MLPLNSALIIWWFVIEWLCLASAIIYSSRVIKDRFQLYSQVLGLFTLGNAIIQMQIKPVFLAIIC